MHRGCRGFHALQFRVQCPVSWIFPAASDADAHRTAGLGRRVRVFVGALSHEIYAHMHTLATSQSIGCLVCMLSIVIGELVIIDDLNREENRYAQLE